MKLLFQKRLALFNTTAAGIIIAIVYGVIYMVVNFTGNNHLDQDIQQEERLLMNNLDLYGDSIAVTKLPETEQAEKNSVEANPVFVQINDNGGHILFLSPNLNGHILAGNKSPTPDHFSNRISGTNRIRQGQFPLWNQDGKRMGTVTIAISRDEAYIVLRNLLLILVLSYPIVIVVLYFFLLFSVKKAIAPVQQLIRTAARINDTNIGMRMPLPEQEDEIYHLATTINDLLDRLEKSMTYQKQFTADASHEMRTPLSAIRGILEVTIRKKRETEHYERSIREAIKQVDRMHLLMEQLLHLARLTAGVITANFAVVNMKKLIEGLDQKLADRKEEKNVSIHLNIPANKDILTDSLLLEHILENLINNAIKYGRNDGKIYIEWQEKTNSLMIADNGFGISPEHLPHLFERFYRADRSRNSRIPGNGLGLAIVSKLCNLLNIQISVSSSEDRGTSFHLRFSPTQALRQY